MGPSNSFTKNAHCCKNFRCFFRLFACPTKHDNENCEQRFSPNDWQFHGQTVADRSFRDVRILKFTSTVAVLQLHYETLKIFAKRLLLLKRYVHFHSVALLKAENARAYGPNTTQILVHLIVCTYISETARLNQLHHIIFPSCLWPVARSSSGGVTVRSVPPGFVDTFSYTRSYGGVTVPQQRCCNAVYDLTSLLHAIACILSHTTAGFKACPTCGGAWGEVSWQHVTNWYIGLTAAVDLSTA